MQLYVFILKYKNDPYRLATMIFNQIDDQTIYINKDLNLTLRLPSQINCLKRLKLSLDSSFLPVSPLKKSKSQLPSRKILFKKIDN